MSAYPCTRYADAQGYYERAHSLAPDNAEIQQLLAKMSLPSQDHNPPAMSADHLYTAAQKKAEEGDRSEAIALLEQVLALDASYALAHNDLGVLNYESGNMQAALRHYEKAAALMPENEVFQKNLADFYWFHMQDHQRAMERYVQVLKLDPREMETLLSCGQICQSLGKADDARDFYNTALQIEPWNKDAKQLLHRLETGANGTDFEAMPDGRPEKAPSPSSGAGRHDADAIQDLERSLIHSPDSAKAYNDLGVRHYEAGDKPKALECYEKAVTLDPKTVTYSKNLADFYLVEQSRAEDAMKLYLHVLESDPEDIEALAAVGTVSAALGKREDAHFFYGRVLEIEPWNAFARKALNSLNDPSEGQLAAGVAKVALG